MNRISEDIKNINIQMSGNSISVNLQHVNNPATRQIVLLNIIREQGSIKNFKKTKMRRVEARISETDIRYFWIPEHVDAYMLHTNIHSDKAFQNFAKPS